MIGKDFCIVRAGEALVEYGETMGEFNAIGQTSGFRPSADSLNEIGLIVDGKMISPDHAVEALKKQGRLDEIHCMAIGYNFDHFVGFYQSIKNN